MYRNIKSKLKINNTLSEEVSYYVGVRQGEPLSPFLFSMYINDLEGELMQNDIDGIDIGMLKLYLLLYADDIVIFSMSSEGLQKGLDVLCDYCQRWKLTVNTDKTKVMFFFFFFGREEICLEIYLLVIREVILRLLISLFISGLHFLQVVLLMRPIRHYLGKHLRQFLNLTNIYSVLLIFQQNIRLNCFTS